MSTLNAISAATHANPYPYYQEMLNGPPLVFDPSLHLWIASKGDVILEILAHPDCHVRPVAEPVPKAIAGTPAGTVFGHLVRMNDGERHERPKFALQKALSQIDLENVHATTARFSRILGEKHALPNPDKLGQWMVEVPIYTVCSLLGFDESELASMGSRIGDFVACLSPLSGAAQIIRSGAAAEQLLLDFKALMQTSASKPGSVVRSVQDEAAAIGWQQADAITANLLGLLSQTYEATAGLIGNSIVALMRDEALHQKIMISPALCKQLVEEVSRMDPSVQNTRRFVAKPLTVAGTELNTGDAILLLLAAANYDPSFNHRPHEFLLARERRCVFGFGHGRHGCPGQLLAYTIAAVAIEELIKASGLPDRSRTICTYRPSVNGRIPVFSTSV